MRTYLQMICMLLAARLPRLIPSRLARWAWTRKSKAGDVLTWPDKVGIDIVMRGSEVVAVTSELYENGCEFGSITAETEELSPSVIYLLRCAVPGAIPEEPDKAEKLMPSRTTPMLAGLLIMSLLAGCCETVAAERTADQLCQEEVDALRVAWEARINLADFKTGYESTVGWKATAPKASRAFFETGPGNYREAHKIMIGHLTDKSAATGVTPSAVGHMTDDELMDDAIREQRNTDRDAAYGAVTRCREELLKAVAD